jgi:hypothetical protein
MHKWRTYGQKYFTSTAFLSGALAFMLTLSNYYYSKVK